MDKNKEKELFREFRELRNEYKGNVNFKNKTQVSIYLTPENLEKLNLLRAAEKRKMSDIYDEAIILYEEYHKKLRKKT